MHGIDYTKIFALMIRHDSLRIFLAIAILLGMINIQMNVISAYFESSLGQYNHPIYMNIPKDVK